MNNPYKILGVSEDISSQALKKAYRDLCRKYHPDNCGSSSKFDEITKAYNQILSGVHIKKTVVHTGLFKYSKT